jgi:hypothetical protein
VPFELLILTEPCGLLQALYAETLEYCTVPVNGTKVGVGVGVCVEVTLVVGVGVGVCVCVGVGVGVGHPLQGDVLVAVALPFVILTTILEPPKAK